MSGRPVWLASVSKWKSRRTPLLTHDWPDSVSRKASHILSRLLGDAGDPARERVFRMNLTLCRHRALSDLEIGGLPSWWHDAPAVDIAGGPVEVISMTGIDDIPSTRPCEEPGWARLPMNYAVKIPVDCGSCGPCTARQACRSG